MMMRMKMLMASSSKNPYVHHDCDLGDDDDDGDDDLLVKRTLKISDKTQSKYRAKVKLNKVNTHQ